jgi:serine/threonine protein kinase
MKQIKISFAKGTGLDPFFDHISSITVDDAPFAEGGFGDIYHAHDFNGDQQSQLRQVIKVFKPSTVGKDVHSWNTIVRLQKKLMEEMELCSDNGQVFLDQYPALIAMPQFVFEGTMDGRTVRGYATNNLNDLGYVSFDKVIEEGDSPYIEEFERRSMKWRFTMAYHLVHGFNLLYKMHFLHADISSDNIFVSLTQPTCAIIDFDSGSIVETMEDNPSTFGKYTTWLAPEISFQLKKGQSTSGNMLVEINSFTDAWSVANALLNVLILMPAYYLNDMSENSLRAYVNKYTWPEVNFNDPLFDSDNEDAYNYFQEVFVKMLPEEVRREFVVTFSKGIFKPSLRTSYSRWERIFRNLVGVYLPPSPPPYLKDMENYINDLVQDVINGEENLNRHEFFINEMAKKAKLDGEKIMSELKEFVELYKDCIADNVITKFEMSNLLVQGKMAMISKDTIDLLLKPYRKL